MEGGGRKEGGREREKEHVPLPSAVKAPVIRFIKQPWSWVVAEGGRFRLLCQAVCSSGEPVLYQWFFNSRELAGETNTQLVR